MSDVRKIAAVIPISDELLREYSDREPLMESIRRAPERRRKRLADEITYGPQLNPCIQLGGQDG